MWLACCISEAAGAQASGSGGRGVHGRCIICRGVEGRNGPRSGDFFGFFSGTSGILVVNFRRFLSILVHLGMYILW